MLTINRAAPRRLRLPEFLFSTLAIVFAVAAWHISQASPRMAIGATTQFDQVAVFATGTPSAAIEAWRVAVLGRVHGQACRRGLPCVQRTLRLSGIGPMRADVLAFDLDPATPAAERRAIALAGTNSRLTQPRLHAATTPLLAAGG